LDNEDPVFGQHWTTYRGLHLGSCTDCDCEAHCDCEGHTCVGAQSTVGHAAAAITSAKSVGILLIVVEPPSPSPSQIEVYSWHW
jgi:hypothetical protein